MAQSTRIPDKIKSEGYIQASEVLSKLQEAGFKAYFVGGCVRDLLMGLTPKDYDIATDAEPENVNRIFPKARGFGKRFGVSIVPTSEGNVEVAAFRKDGFYYDHRRPAWVEYAGVADDAVRRDFTLNALYYDPVTDETIDLVDGLSDLKARILRMIGDPFERFDEDWLRILRAVRFAARFALRFDPCTWDALHSLTPMVTGISAERRTEEVRLMLRGANPGRAIGLLISSGLWRTMWPNLPFTTKRIRKANQLLKKNRSKTAVWKHFFVELPSETIIKTCDNLRLTKQEKKSLGIKL